MAGKQAGKMAEKQTSHIKDKKVLSAAPIQVPRVERIPTSGQIKRLLTAANFFQKNLKSFSLTCIKFDFSTNWLMKD